MCCQGQRWQDLLGFRGPVHDAAVLRTSGLLEILGKDEQLLGDKGYVGFPQVIAPKKGKDLTEEDLFVNKFINDKRVIVEMVFGRMKIFQCLQKPWRQSYEKQHKVFLVCAHITNKKMALSPVWKKKK